VWDENDDCASTNTSLSSLSDSLFEEGLEAREDCVRRPAIGIGQVERRCRIACPSIYGEKDIYIYALVPVCHLATCGLHSWFLQLPLGMCDKLQEHDTCRHRRLRLVVCKRQLS
jgi:hypothetical protein